MMFSRAASRLTMHRMVSTAALRRSAGPGASKTAGAYAAGLALAGTAAAASMAQQQCTSCDIKSMPIHKWFMKHRENKEIKKIQSLFADDAEVIFTEVDVPESMSLADYLAAEESLYASFPDLSVTYFSDALSDNVGDGLVEVDALVSGTFTGEDFVYGDNPAVVATGEAISKATTYKMVVHNNKIIKLVIVGGTPKFFYDAVAAETPTD